MEHILFSDNQKMHRLDVAVLYILGRSFCMNQRLMPIPDHYGFESFAKQFMVFDNENSVSYFHCSTFQCTTRSVTPRILLSVQPEPD